MFAPSHTPSLAASQSMPLPLDPQPAAPSTALDAPKPITEGNLLRAEKMLSTLLQIGVNTLDAYVIVFDHLNTDSEASYTAALRHSTQHFPPPKEKKNAPPTRWFARAQPPQAAVPFASRPSLSWPEKVLMCEDGGRHVTLIAGMAEHIHNADEGINRGYRDLPPGCVDYVTLPGRRAPTRQTLGEFRRWHVTNHMDPAIRELKPNQVLLMAPPDSYALLVGLDSEGRLFGFDTKKDSSRDLAPSAHLMSEADVTYALNAIRSCGAHVSNWAIMKPR